MKIIYNTNEKSNSFKLKHIVGQTIVEMDSVIDEKNMQPSLDGEEFALKCLNLINKINSPSTKITKQNITEPCWADFKRNCKREWHTLKAKNLSLRTYFYQKKGWLLMKVDTDTPTEVYNKLGTQSRERLVPKLEMHNRRIITDAKLIGTKPSGEIEYKE